MKLLDRYMSAVAYYLPESRRDEITRELRSNAFAIVTGIFYVLSNPPGGAPVLQPYRCWRAEQLPPIIHQWQRIGTA